MRRFLGTWKNVPFAHLSPGAYNVQAVKTFGQTKLHKPDTPQLRLPLPWLFTLSFLEFTHLSLQKTTQRKVVPEEKERQSLLEVKGQKINMLQANENHLKK